MKLTKPHFLTGILLLIPLFLSACGNDDLPKYSLLGGLRILAIKASNAAPEVAPGDSVDLTPLVSDINGAGRTLTYQRDFCLDPGISYGADPNCNAGTIVPTVTGTYTLTGPRYTEAPHTLTVTVPATVLTQRSLSDQYNGVAVLFVYQVSAANGDKAVSFKRIIVSTKTPKNANPTITSVQKDGSLLTALSGTSPTLTPVLGAGSQESYSFMGSSGSLIAKTESLTVSWFINTGTMKYARTDAASNNIWTATDGATATPFLVVVVRDDRGGVDFTVVP